MSILSLTMLLTHTSGTSCFSRSPSDAQRVSVAPEVGTNSDSDGHLIYTTSGLHGGLRCPEIVINNQWCKRCSFETSKRWVAVKFSPGLLLVTLTLPPSRLAMSEVTEILEELENNESHHWYGRIDANDRNQ